MERTRRGPDETTTGRTRRASAPARQPGSLTDEILDLQSTAGNRSVASAIGDAAVQRDSKSAAAARNDGGILTFDSGEVLPLQTVTWSVSQKITTDTRGKSRFPEIIPGRIDFGDLQITRLRDTHSLPANDLLEANEHDHATLTLNQASADGGLPAETFELRNVGLKEIIQPKGDDPTERLTLYVEGMTIAGQVKGDSKANAKAKARAVAHISLDGGPPTPVIRWERVSGGPKVMVSRASGPEGDEPLPTGRPDPSDPLTIRIEIPAGRTLDQVAATLGENHRFNGTLTLRGGSRIELRDMLVTEIKSTADPGIVRVSLVAEISRTRRPNE